MARPARAGHRRHRRARLLADSLHRGRDRRGDMRRANKHRTFRSGYDHAFELKSAIANKAGTLKGAGKGLAWKPRSEGRSTELGPMPTLNVRKYKTGPRWGPVLIFLDSILHGHV